MALLVLDTDEVTESAKKSESKKSLLGLPCSPRQQALVLLAVINALAQDYCFAVCQTLACPSLQAMVTPLQR